MGRLDSGLAVGPQHHAHFLQHVAIVVDARFVNADSYRYTCSHEPVKRCDTALESEVGTAVVAQHGAGVGTHNNVVIVHPDPMTYGQPGSRKSYRVDVSHRSPPGPALRIHLLIGCFEQMHVHRHIMAFR